ncbi:MAG TPA: hypothetical protein PK563_13840 [Tenuifilaceae bacterium]|nr:hypothetical protein [Tenuifilaceae bacterium]
MAELSSPLQIMGLIETNCASDPNIVSVYKYITEDMGGNEYIGFSVFYSSSNDLNSSDFRDVKLLWQKGRITDEGIEFLEEKWELYERDEYRNKYGDTIKIVYSPIGKDGKILDDQQIEQLIKQSKEKNEGNKFERKEKVLLKEESHTQIPQSDYTGERILTEFEKEYAHQHSLINAIKNNDIDKVKEATKYTELVNFCPNYEKLPIILALYDRTDPKILEILLEAGADPNIKIKDGTPLLADANNYSKLEKFEMLLKYGADPNTLLGSYENRTILYEVIDYLKYQKKNESLEKSYKKIKLLLEAGANPDGILNKKNYYTLSPILRAVELMQNPALFFNKTYYKILALLKKKSKHRWWLFWVIAKPN